MNVNPRLRSRNLIDRRELQVFSEIIALKKLKRIGKKKAGSELKALVVQKQTATLALLDQHDWTLHTSTLSPVPTIPSPFAMPRVSTHCYVTTASPPRPLHIPHTNMTLRKHIPPGQSPYASKLSNARYGNGLVPMKSMRIYLIVCPLVVSMWNRHAHAS